MGGDNVWWAEKASPDEVEWLLLLVTRSKREDSWSFIDA
jgi:hypothetical protein